ncbi:MULTISPECIES: FAD-dependent monooxygenase [Pseudonocardia]|uniref:3-hydroxybenzoate 6-hydroxylase 1 n=2 Tax=Pseudonocardia TaxID=1847 RepID=A0A1Y2MPX9_PSEAH|nr:MULTISPECIES: FAD-dependent monooxygenase [Pseudonocardia]OSY36747.1 3-hydroxybenzoate 6-hydroxylase 1 [Pseudonocardia autotrophica]TDN77138.1 2-polyprenyl-6-methoxyphenol hydroxylase-like FAD-dependent oxidoreductase [Pseudonocardia autotrophica]BBG01143.1 salicylate 1-monooxygenase [Pseudonocardia autotrophica]GEC26801.1 salicylate 1-monooxygenase [Pseudonocardia saturnea]
MPDVVVVGGGIGGLVTALALHRVGVGVAVYEQGSGRRELGVGLNVLPHAGRVLADLGLLDRLAEAGVRTAEMTYAHRLGMPVVRRPVGVAAGSELPMVACHRGRLQRILVDAVRERLGPDAVRTGSRVVAVDPDGGAVTLASGAVVAGDVLVGADGIHSVVRDRLFPDEGPPRWNGVAMWRGATDWPPFRGGRSMIVAGGTDAKLVVYPIGPGRTPGTVLTNWAVCIRTGVDGGAPPQRQDWARIADPADPARHAHRFRQDEVDHHALIAGTAESYEFPMCDRDPLPHWNHGRTTLLGDAAHPMFPMGSNGAGQAILDAEALARHLVTAGSTGAALRAYQDERLPVTADIVLRNRAGGPEQVIDEVERRAPDGFGDLSEIMSIEERDAILASYAAATGAAPPR